jgi:hypothetical protein
MVVAKGVHGLIKIRILSKAGMSENLIANPKILHGNYSFVQNFNGCVLTFWGKTIRLLM